MCQTIQISWPRCIAIMLATLCITSPSGADTFTWDGQFNGNWAETVGTPPNAITNWNPDVTIADPIPDADDVVVFSNASLNTTVDMNGDRTVQAILFGGTTDYTITPGGLFSLTLTTGDVTTALGMATHEVISDITLGSNGDWNIGNSLFEVSGGIGGAFALNKSGFGTLQLTGASSYTGDTNILQGTLVATGSEERLPNSPVQISPGAALRIDGITETVEGIKNSAGSLFLDNGATLQLAPTALRIFPGTISGAADTTFAVIGGSTQRLDGASPDFYGTALITGSKIRINNANALQNATVDIQADDGLDVTTEAIDANFGALAGSGALSLGSQTLRTGLNNSSTTYAGVVTGNSDSILKQDGTGTLTLTGGSDATPSSFGTLRSQNADGTIVVDGARIDLTSTDLGVLAGALLANQGDIRLQNGADVQMAAGSRGLTRDGSITVTGSGTSLTGERLDSAAGDGDTGPILIEDHASVAITQFLVVGVVGDGGLTVQSGATASANDVLVGLLGSGDLLVTGADSVLSATNALSLGGLNPDQLGGTGMLTVEDGGDVQVNAGRINFWTSTSSIIINGGTLETDSLFEHTGVTGTISLFDPVGGVALTVGTGDGNSTFAGLIQDAAGGPGSLKKVGTGNLTLAGANTHSGDTIIDTGKIVVTTANALQNSTVNINVDDGLDVTTNTVDANIGALAGSGDLDVGSQSLTAGSNDNSTTYSGILSGTGGAFTKAGTGTLAVAGNNTYSGGTVVEGGTLSISDDSNLGNTSGSVEIKTGATLNVSSSHATSRGLSVTKSSSLDPATISANAGQIYTINGVISGNVGPTFRGPGAIILNGTNIFDATQSSGVLTVLQAIVQISSDDNLGDPSVDLEFDGVGSTLVVAATHSTNRDFVFFSGSPGISVDAGQVYTINGNITSPFQTGFDKLGEGVLVLTTENNFGGGVRVDKGTLLANNTTGSATGTGLVQVHSGATLGGTGGVAGTVTVLSGGSVAPSMSPGTLGIGGDLNLQAGSFLDIELGGLTAGTEHDRVEVSGFADLLGNLNVTLINSFTPSAGDSFAFLFAEGGFNAAFASLNLPDLSALNLDWQLDPGDSTLFLDVVSTGVPGDYNGNGVVDAADYTVWRDTLGQIGDDLAADGTGPGGEPDGVVDELDYQFWVDNFGNTLGGVSLSNTTVPEPATLVLWIVAAVGCCLWRDRTAKLVQPTTH